MLAMRTAVAVMGMGLLLGAAASQPAPDAAVLVEGYAFQPASVTIPAGGSVTWTLGADPEQHTVTPVGPAPFEDSGNLFSGDTFEATFGEAGSWEYVCTLHPTMRGTVAVLSAASSMPAESGSASPDPVSSPTIAEATPSAAATAPPDPGTPTADDAGSVLPIGVLVAIAAVVIGLAATWLRRRR
jgi:plastocyanin